MCNINLLIKKNKNLNKLDKKVLDIITSLSYLNNSDSEGYLTLNLKNEVNTIKKSLNKVFFDNLKPYEYLVLAHERISTSGFNEDNTQPLNNKEFIIAHNGVFTNKGCNKKSDTNYFLESLTKYYNRNNGDLIKSIKELLINVSGSFSVVIYDKKTKKMFYFKNDMTSFYSIENNNFFLGSTSKDNLVMANKLLNLNLTINQIEPFKIYNVLNDFEVVGSFEEKQSIFFEYKFNSQYWNYKPYTKKERKEYKKQKERELTEKEYRNIWRQQDNDISRDIQDNLFNEY